MISVLIVNYNGERFLEKCLDSVARCSVGVEGGFESGPEGGLEVIVVDNGSSDGSLAILRQRPDIRLLELDENLGFGAANNRAAKLARGDAFLFLNSDAWLLPGALGALRRALGHEQCGLAAPRVRRPDGTPESGWVPEISVLGEGLQLLRNRLPPRLGYGPGLERLLRACLKGWFTGACFLVRREAFEAIAGFDAEFFLYFEDADLCRRLRLAGWRLERVADATAVHVGGGSTLERGGNRFDRIALEYRRSQLRYYRKHRPAWEQAVLARRLRRKYRGTALGAALALDGSSNERRAGFPGDG